MKSMYNGDDVITNKGEIVIDGREFATYRRTELYNSNHKDGKAIDFRYYAYVEGINTFVFEVKMYPDCEEEYKLEEHLKWKDNELAKDDWLEDMRSLADFVNKLLNDDGRNHVCFKVIPEKSLIYFRKDMKVSQDENNTGMRLLNRLVNTLPAIRECIGHGSSFLLEEVDENDEVLSSYTFTPEDLDNLSE